MKSMIGSSIPNSPIEFVFVGPVRGRDRILLSSDNAGLDVKGLAIGRDINPERIGSDEPSFPIPALFSSKLLLPKRQLNIIESYSVHDIEPSIDSRKSFFRLAWVGYCSGSSRTQIESVLNRTAFELYSAVKNGDDSEVELLLSPVILSCSLAHYHQLYLQSKIRFTYIILTIMFILATLVGVYIATVETFLNRVK